MADRKLLEHNGFVFECAIARNLARRYPNAIILQNKELYSHFLKKNTQIDLIMICNRGVFIIEAKNWKRWVKGSYSDNHWLGQGSSVDVIETFSPTGQNMIHIRALRNSIRTTFGVEPVDFHNIVCFPNSTALDTDCSEVMNVNTMFLTIDHILITSDQEIDVDLYSKYIEEVTVDGK